MRWEWRISRNLLRAAMARSTEEAEMTAAAVVVASRPRRTGSLWRSMGRKRPVVGSARTIRSLKEFVPMSTAAKKAAAAPVVEDCGSARLVDILTGGRRENLVFSFFNEYF